jgi:pyruvate dehydrogenase E2 component (dihydrolipoamide acetyltransferase)
MSEFRMPSLGADMEKARMGVWLVEPGDRVKRGQVIAEVETDKGIIEIEVYEDGIVDRIIVESGREVPVGEVLAVIRTEGAPAGPAVLQEPPAARAPERIRISPAARRRAGELGVDISTLKGTGPDGSITLADVESGQKGKAAPPPEVEKQASDFAAGMRKAIAAAMARSNREIPHYYLETQVDMSRPLRWLEAENLKRAVKDRVLPVAMLVKAVACALKEVPELNGYWTGEGCQVQESIHIGFAVTLKKGGLFVPAIHDVDKKSLGELMEAMNDIIVRTRAGRLRGSEMTDATITVTNLGDLGVEAVYGVIYPPQVALVGFGRVTERPWAENGMLGVRPVLTATLAGDHRATDGIVGARFLNALNRYLQEPEKL